MDPESHLSLLDAFAGLEATRAGVEEAFARVQVLRSELQALQLDERQKAARIDLLTFQRDEIARAQIRPGEDEELAATRQVLVNAEKLQRLSAEAYAALYESDGAVLGALTGIWRRVGELAALDPRVAPYLEPRDAIKSQLEDLAFFLRGYAEDIDASPARLQEVDDRLVLLERLKRKYGPDARRRPGAPRRVRDAISRRWPASTSGRRRPAARWPARARSTWTVPVSSRASPARCRRSVRRGSREQPG